MTVFVRPNYAELIRSFGNLGILLPLGATDGLTDLSGNGRDGTGAGGITPGGYSPGPLAHDDEGATDFDGTDDRITTGYNPFTNGTSRTFMGWAYRNNTAAVHALIASTSGGGTQPLVILLSGTTDLRFGTAGTTGGSTWASAVTTASWFHWAVSYDGANAVLYINGALVSPQAQSTVYSSPGNLQIGAYGPAGTTYPFDGKQAWVSVHERELTALQISAAATGSLAATRYVKVGENLVVA